MVIDPQLSQMNLSLRFEHQASYIIFIFVMRIGLVYPFTVADIFIPEERDVLSVVIILTLRRDIHLCQLLWPQIEISLCHLYLQLCCLPTFYSL